MACYDELARSPLCELYLHGHANHSCEFKILLAELEMVDFLVYNTEIPPMSHFFFAEIVSLQQQ